MHRNPIWIAFFALVLLISLFFLFKAASLLVSYARLSESVEGKIEKVEVVERKEGRFIVWATFSFPYKGERLVAEGEVGPIYANRFVAEKAASSLSQERPTIWYNPKHPNQARIGKTFPLKAVISGVMLALLALYFFMLGRYVAKRRNSH
jgi:hypothetical protein